MADIPSNLVKVTNPIFRVPVEILTFQPRGNGNYGTKTFTEYHYTDAPNPNEAANRLSEHPCYWMNYDKMSEEEQRVYSPIKLGKGEIVQMPSCLEIYKDEHERYICGLRLEEYGCDEIDYCPVSGEQGGCYLEGCPPSDFPGCPYFGEKQLAENGLPKITKKELKGGRIEDF